MASENASETASPPVPGDAAPPDGAPAPKPVAAGKPAPPEAGAEAVAKPVLLGKRYEIQVNQPLAEFTNGQGPVHAVQIRDGDRSNVMALVSDSPSGGRTDVLSALRGTESTAFLRLVDAGIATFHAENRQRFVLIYERPPGPLLMRSLAVDRPPLHEDVAIRQVLAPALAALRDLSGRGVFHGAVRPDNIFFSKTGHGSAVLGDCAATLASLTQPTLFETLERGLAQPAGRGAGAVEDDLYALAVSLVILLHGKDPLRGMSDEAISALKMERGSYAAIAGQVAVPQTLLEPLRAMLSDDPKQRWSLDDCELWLSGKRKTPVQAALPRRAQRSLAFKDREHWRPETLSIAMTEDVGQAIKLIDEGALDRWLVRSTGQKDLADQVKEAADSAASIGKNGSFEQRVVARVAIALYPGAPIRFQGLSVLPFGFGNLLGHLMATNQDYQAAIDVLKGQMALFWFNSQETFKPEYMPLLKQFDQARQFLIKKDPGFGIERCVYELCPTLPCLSEMFQDRLAITPAEVLTALDAVAGRGDRPRTPVDRHIAAYLAVRERGVKDNHLLPLSQPFDSLEHRIGALTLLAGVQARNGAVPLRRLSAWMIDILEPAILRFRNRKRQQKIRDTLKDASERGLLPELLGIVTNKELLRKDEEGFKLARRDFVKLQNELRRLRRQIERRKLVEEGPGREAAAMVAGVAGLATITLTLLYRLVGF